MPTILQRLVAFNKLITSGAADQFHEDLDFAIQRTNFQANEQERHIYQSYRALRPFIMFAGFSAISSVSLLCTKILSMRPQWPLGLHFKFCMMLGTTYMLGHYYISKPYEVRHLLLTPNSSFSAVSYAILDTRPDKDLWFTAFPELPQQAIIEENRQYFAVPNYHHSGHPAVIVANPNIKQTPSVQYSTVIDPLIPVDGVELTKEELFGDIRKTNELYHAAKLDSPLQTKTMSGAGTGQYDEYAAKVMKQRSIKSFCDLHDIPMPSYYDDFRLFNSNEDQTVLQRPVDFLHMYNEDDKKVRGHLPLAFQSPMDILAVNKSRQELQEKVNQQAKEFYQQQLYQQNHQEEVTQTQEQQQPV